MNEYSELIYKSLQEGTLLQTYQELTNDIEVIGFQDSNCKLGKKSYAEYFVEGFRQYILDIWNSNNAEWKSKVGEYIQITDEEYWKHYSPYRDGIRVHCCIGFGGKYPNFEEGFWNEYKHAERHYELEKLSTGITITDGMIKNNDTECIHKWTTEQLDRIHSKLNMFFFSYKKNVQYVGDIVNIELANCPIEGRTMTWGGIQMWFELRWLIEH